MGLVKVGSALLVRDGALATSTNCCCGGLCPACPTPPATLVMKLPKLWDWTQYAQRCCQLCQPPLGAPPDWECDWAQAMDNGYSGYVGASPYCACGPFWLTGWQGAGAPCWTQWSNGGCARCQELSESEQTLVQYPNLSAPDCSHLDDPDLPPCDPVYTDPSNCSSCCCSSTMPGACVLPCLWEKSIGLCSQWFSVEEDASCCNREILVTPWSQAHSVGIPHTCSGFTAADNSRCPDAADPGLVPGPTHCQCNDCNWDGVTMCPGGGCYMAFHLKASIEDVSTFWRVRADVCQLWAWYGGNPGLLASHCLTGIKDIPKAGFDCFATPLEFTCADVNYTSLSIGSYVGEHCRFASHLGTDYVPDGCCEKMTCEDPFGGRYECDQCCSYGYTPPGSTRCGHVVFSIRRG